jgi:hypothetical protein
MAGLDNEVVRLEKARGERGGIAAEIETKPMPRGKVRLEWNLSTKASAWKQTTSLLP